MRVKRPALATRATRSRMSQTQLWLEPEMREALSVVEDGTNESMSAVVRAAILYFLEREWPEALRAAGIAVVGRRSRARDARAAALVE